MREFSSFGAFAAYLRSLQPAVERAAKIGLEAACVVIETEAKAEIGTYQDAAGPFSEWAQLAESTLAEKTRLGFAPPDNPLLRTGELRDSIEHTVAATEAAVGSNSDIAVYQELGTERIPPRSFLGGAAVRKEEEAVRLMVEPIVRVMAGQEPTLEPLRDAA